MERHIIREDEIRPDNLQKELVECHEADLRWIKARFNEFRESSCPACSASARFLLFTKDGIQYYKCANCETAYISPRPCPVLLSEFYSASKAYKLYRERIFPASREIRRREFFLPRVRRIIEACTVAGFSGPAILEVGAGFGIFCEEAMRSNFFKRVVGVEPHRDLAAECRSRGIHIIEKMVEDVHPEEIGPVNVICAFEVFEHVLEPRRLLASSRNLLREGGLLFLGCPNGKGFDLSMLGPLSDTYNFQHLNYFNPSSIRLLLENCGYQVLDIRTPGKLDVDLVRKAVLEGRIDLGPDAFLRRVLVDESTTLGAPFQEFLAANRLSGHMEVTARVR